MSPVEGLFTSTPAGERRACTGASAAASAASATPARTEARIPTFQRRAAAPIGHHASLLRRGRTATMHRARPRRPFG